MPPAPPVPLVVFMACLLLLCLSFFAPMTYTSPSRGRSAAYMGIQSLAVLCGLLLGWNVIGNAIWEASGGCSAHGGSFEGNCGFAGVADLAIAAIETAAVASTLSAIGLYVWNKRSKKYNGTTHPTDDAAKVESREP